MRYIDEMNRVQAYVNRLDSERRSSLQKIKSVYFLDLMQQTDDNCIGYGMRERTLEDCTGWQEFSADDTWGGPDYHAAFAFSVNITKEMHGRCIGFSLDTGADDIWNTDNPQIMVYINKKLTCAMDMNHHEVILSDCAQEDETYDIRLYAYVNSPEKSNFLYIKIFAKEPEVEALYYDMKLPLEAASNMRPEDEKRRKLLSLLNQAGDMLDLRVRFSNEYKESIRKASEWLKENLYEKEWECDLATVYAIGHTHIDVAWKWPLRQTREKAVRSFSTVLYLMERYPEYKFFFSQPQLYEYVKQEAPEIYEKVKARIKEGRWEADGAMWLESDCNLTSGESLIRQIMYGKKFFKEEFGIERQQILWLPDAFGFLGALPQIMKRSNIPYFLTTKMGWNDSNQQPDDTFIWEGIDGSRVTGMYITTKDYEAYPERFAKPVREVTYNGRQNASQIMGTWQNYRNKDLSDAVLTIYGFGDGGGGPTEGMLEQSRRLSKGILGVPKVKLSGLNEYLSVMDEKICGKELNTWYGDLYLEYHRGTFSSIAENKKNNRECEYKNQEAEWMAALAWWMTKDKEIPFEYPKEELERAWKLLLLNQFHDILPGSAIEEVYKQSDKDYESIRKIDSYIIKEAMNVIAEALADGNDTNSLSIWNPLGFEARQVLSFDMSDKRYEALNHACVKGASGRQQLSDKTVLIEAVLAPKGETALELCEMQSVDTEKNVFVIHADNKIETPYYFASWNDKGEIISLYDKEAQRELVKENTPANEIVVYEDIPKEYDAWNIESYYSRKKWKMDVSVPCHVTECGEICTILHTRLKYQSSWLEQDIIFYAHNRRIDFKTRMDWREQQQLIKAEFSFDIMSRMAACEIPYGVSERPTHRNTGWQRAQFESCVHRFADLSEPEYGVALLNDSRYGYSIHDSVMGLTLLTSGIFPYPDADKGYHECTYAILPHIHDWRHSDVVQQAWMLNEKPLISAARRSCKNYSMFNISAQNVIITSVKRSEDNEGLIVRMYESCGMRTKAVWTMDGISPKQIWECDLMENKEKQLDMHENKTEFEIRPYEIKTFLLR